MAIKITEINKLYDPWVGGIETHVKQLVDGLKDNFSIEVVCCHSLFLKKIDISDGVKITRYGSFGRFMSMPVSLSFLFNLKKHHSDILHFHLPNPLAVLSYFICRPKGNVLITWHSDIIKQKWLMFFYRPLLFWFLGRAKAIITTSPNLLKNSLYLYKFKNKVTVIPLGISKNKYLHKTLPKIDAPKYALFVGRLVYYKGVLTLVDAMQHCNVNVIVIGDGPQRHLLIKKGQSLINQNRLTILPFQETETLHAYFKHCEFFILPSTHPSEAFGIVQLEAMIYSKPIISTDLPTGVPFVNKHQESGLIVSPGNSNALAQAMQTLWNDQQLRESLGHQAYKRCLHLFTDDQMFQKTSDLVKKIYNVQL